MVPRGGRDLSGGSTSDTDNDASGGPTLTQNCWSTPSSFSSVGRGLASPASGLNRFVRGGHEFGQRRLGRGAGGGARQQDG